MSGRKVELDEVTVPAPLLESSSSQKFVSVTPTLISEEANDDDHVPLDQVTTEPHRSTKVRSAPEWYGNPVLGGNLILFLFLTFCSCLVINNLSSLCFICVFCV